MRTCVITGSASGIGHAISESMLADGHRVIGVDLRDAEITADLSTHEGRRHAIAEIIKRTATVDTVVACAGVALPLPVGVRVNYFGTVSILEGLRSLLATSQAPRVAVVTSVAAVHRTLRSIVDACVAGDEDAAVRLAQEAIDSGKGLAIYAASKQAMARWVRKSAQDWAADAIALNAIGPGVVLTPMIARQWADADGRRELSQQVPMPLTEGPVEIEQIVRAARFLVDAENTAITGQCLYVDGGADAALRGDQVW